MKRILVFLFLLCLVFVFLIYPILFTYLFRALIKNEISSRFKGLEVEVKAETTPFFIFSRRFDKVEGKISPSAYVDTNFEFIKFCLEGVEVKVGALLRGRSITNALSWRKFILSGSSTVDQANSFLDSQGFPLHIETNNGKIFGTPLGVKLPWLFGEKERIVLFDPDEKEKSLENILKVVSEGFSVDLGQVAINELKVSADRIDWAVEIKARNFLALQSFIEGFQ